MKTTYLKDYEPQRIVYLPVGTVEWHGNHLPLETDALIAEKLCHIISTEHPGVVLPSIFLGNDKISGDLRGMENYIGKKLPGEIYYIEPELLTNIINALINNLERFEKIYIITGHAGSKQIETLEKIDENNNKVIFINPYSDIKTNVKHADEYETSLFWACYPEEEIKSRSISIDKDDDYFKWLGYDPRMKASVIQGKKLLGIILKTINEKL